jgi:nicotinate-nucleotide adenylyltransferase
MAEQIPDTRVGIYGGTFAPIHNAHVETAKLFMEQMRLDYLFVIPSAIPPHKDIDPQDDPMHRLKMCELAFEGIDGVVVSDMEIKRGGKSYTVDTLNALSAKGRRLLLLCGTDMVLSFDTWYKYREILDLCYPVYMRREKDAMLDNLIVNKLAKYYNESGKMFRKLVGEPIELNSTEIREAVKAGKSISHMVPAKVEKYIIENRLYRD